MKNTDVMNLNEALVLANTLHKDQTRKGNDVPYISHLMRVSGFVLEYGGSIDEAIAALLHDSLEDQGDKITPVDISNLFGPVVHDIVIECSDSLIPNKEEKEAWTARKEKYIAKIATKSAGGKLVMAADKLDNLRITLADHRRIGSLVWDRFNCTKEESQWYYTSILEELKKSGFDNPIMIELEKEISNFVKL